MPKGWKRTDDDSERLDQQAETNHRKDVAAFLERLPTSESTHHKRMLAQLRKALGIRRR